MRFALIAGLAAGLSGTTHAYTYEWSGNVLARGPARISTSFTVLELKGDAGDVFQTGHAGFDAAFVQGDSSPAFDTSARYLYLFQDVNLADSAADATEVRTRVLPATSRAITSWGRFEGLGFADEEGPVDAANPLGGRVEGADPYAAHRGVASPKVVALGDTPDRGVGANVRLSDAWLTRVYDAPSDLKRGRRATLIGFTSNVAPTFADAVVRPVPRAPADPGSVVDGSPEARGILRLVNLVSALVLRGEVGLSEDGAARVGAHPPFRTLDQLLVLVTTEDFRLLLAFAQDNGYVRP